MIPVAVGISIEVSWDIVRRANTFDTFKFNPAFDNSISTLRIFPGPFSTIRNMLKPPLKGLVMQTFGAGNAPDSDPNLIPALTDACSKHGLVVVNVTQCTFGGVAAHYAVGYPQAYV